MIARSARDSAPAELSAARLTVTGTDDLLAARGGPARGGGDSYRDRRPGCSFQMECDVQWLVTLATRAIACGTVPELRARFGWAEAPSQRENEPGLCRLNCSIILRLFVCYRL